MLGIITSRLNDLKTMKRGGKINTPDNSIKDIIDAKRREIMAQMELAKGNVPMNRSKKHDG